MAQNSIYLEIKSLPSYHSFGSDIYIAGSFNGWNPQNEKFKFQRNENGNYFINLKLDNAAYEYKITRGGWDKTECKLGGAGLGNRTIKVQRDTVVELAIEEWADHFQTVARKSTANKNVHIIDTAFFIPQLKRGRRIWIYLPDDYATSKKQYPVLYLHDGQNVFDDATSFSGEWGVDECIDSMKKKCIVVAIDNGGSKRLNEYCPYDFKLSGIAANYPSNKGEGDKYVDFLVKTLKPFIDRNYRTLKDKPHTFIAGSSMGGLISMYAVLKYPTVFGAVGVFSPAFWVSGTKIFDDIKTKGKKVNSKIYFYGGKQEGETMIPDMLKAFEGMNKVSKSKMETVIRDEGKHNEATWRKEFPLFYKWINP
jgi:predicted alpha/beta superfamily hydrolase